MNGIFISPGYFEVNISLDTVVHVSLNSYFLNSMQCLMYPSHLRICGIASGAESFLITVSGIITMLAALHQCFPDTLCYKTLFPVISNFK